MRVNLAATKTNLFKVRKSLDLTKEGYELLDEKRKILLQELSMLVDAVDRFQDELDNIIAEAYKQLDKTVVSLGKKRVEEISLAIDIQHKITLAQRRLMGVSIPTISLTSKENPPYFSGGQVNLFIDESIVKFQEVLKVIIKLAEKKIALLRIAAEVQKTIRKVNALEKVYLPYYKEAAKYISERIEEEARDAFAMLKMIKNRIKHDN